MTETKLIAHGGFSAAFPENTLQSFIEAAKFHPFAIEMDVVEDESGHLVCYHPQGISSNQGTFTVEQVKSQVGSSESFPLLADVVNQIDPTIKILIDFKQPSWETFEKLLTDIPVDVNRLIIGVRNIDDFNAIKAIKPDVETLALFADPDDYEIYHQSGGTYFRLWEKDVTEERVQRIKSLGLEVWVTPGHKATETQPRTAGDADETKLSWLFKLLVDGILVNDIKTAERVSSL